MTHIFEIKTKNKKIKHNIKKKQSNGKTTHEETDIDPVEERRFLLDVPPGDDPLEAAKKYINGHQTDLLPMNSERGGHCSIVLIGEFEDNSKEVLSLRD